MSEAPAPSPDPLAPLLVLDLLEVGPVTVEPRRIRAPYKVVTGGEAHTTALTFRYEEDVLTPGDPASENLAALVAAQVALNYGLFARRLVLHGPFEDADRAWLVEMARNTAREVYVKKFLEPNPFLVGEAAALEPVKREDYLQAEVVFPDPAPAPLEAPALRAEGHLVLSSGGKESLLTYGLLRELGREAHPVFVNESGRHWLTAMNGYRHQKAVEPRTARVWTDADRLFAWMLRRLPFVRQDFARVRADDYPIRLWTLAVFLFATLPVALRRGLGRLLVGDEHDTSRRVRTAGIPHYDGLYDQSRWFDARLSRLLARKGWGMRVTSLLRPLSELLVLDLLASRYPDLQAHQVSCHAAHVEEGRVYPCGSCEKCRRVVGVLTARGHDPTRCGYDESQVARCLVALGSEGVHQAAADAQHLMHLLGVAGHLPEAREPPPPRPEVLQLRLDPERSPPEDLPEDLRGPLLSLYLTRARGVVEREGRAWVPLSGARRRALGIDGAEGSAPPPAPPSGPEPSDASPALPPRPYRLAELTWEEAARRFRETDVALLPVGAIEQHGPHLPLDVDAYDAARLADEVAEACGEPHPLVLPLIPYGVSYHHEDFPGTLSVRPEVLADLVYDVGMAAAGHGIKKLVIVNGHGGNGPTLHFAAQRINRDAHIFTCVDTGETSDRDVDALAETPNDVHAGEIETSTTLALRPEVVRRGREVACVPRFSSEYLDFQSERSVEWYVRTHRISETGVLGDPTKADVEKGRRMWALIVEHLAALVRTLSKLTLEEIHQRRY